MLLNDCENQAKTVIFWKVPAAKRFLLRRVLTLVYSYTCMCVKSCTRQMRWRMPGRFGKTLLREGPLAGSVCGRTWSAAVQTTENKRRGPLRRPVSRGGIYGAQ